MVALEPAIALETCENALRQLMAVAYEQAFGSGWLERISTSDQRQQWAERAVEESRTRKGVASIAEAGLSYANFYELLEFVEEHWEPLAQALGKKASVFPLLKRFDNLRNTVAHNRPLVTFERELYSGIAGQIRNQVTIFMSQQDPTGDFYPRLDSVTDSFGVRYERTPEVKAIWPTVCADFTLHPGDVVTFTCIATDPQDRELEFALVRESSSQIANTAIAKAGAAATLTWNITSEDVRQHAWVNIYMRVRGGEYHRFGEHDEQVAFRYRVDPPTQQTVTENDDANGGSDATDAPITD